MRLPDSRDAREATAAPVGGFVGLGAGFGLLVGLLLSADVPLALAAGAVIGLIVGLSIDAWRIRS